jgi:hypothetical protein
MTKRAERQLQKSKLNISETDEQVEDLREKSFTKSCAHSNLSFAGLVALAECLYPIPSRTRP